ncbi:MAG: hypothetical protein ACAI34_22570, partial [Verrucomicrobium sp.]
EGIKEFWPDYDKLSQIERRNKAEAEWLKIAEFGSRWSGVLKHLELQEFMDSAQQPVEALHHYGHGGESLAHKRLKEYVKANPILLGLKDTTSSILEYTLPSLDTIDVLFKSPECWTAVEVKSKVSDRIIGDYERGIYQTVKYGAILNAMKSDIRYGVPRTVRTILVLESDLPEHLKPLADRLLIDSREKFRPL